MGIVQENRYGVAGPEKVTTDYGVENVNVTSKGGGVKEEKPAEPTEAEKKARLFSDLMTIILVKKKFKPGDERIEEFGHRMDIIVKENSIEIPKPDDIVKVLKEVGLTDIADAYEKVLAGADIEAVVEDMPDMVEEAADGESETEDAPEDADTQEPESEEAVDEGTSEGNAEETTEEAPEEAEPTDGQADAAEEADKAEEAPIEENVAASPEAESPADTAEAPERRRPGRPSSKK